MQVKKEIARGAFGSIRKNYDTALWRMQSPIASPTSQTCVKIPSSSPALP